MLDPMCRREVCGMMHKLHDMGHTIIMITHYVEEAQDCDRVILLKEGRIIASGTPRQILCSKQHMHEANLLMPYPARIYYDLMECGIELDSCPLTEDELEEVLCRSM